MRSAKPASLNEERQVAVTKFTIATMDQEAMLHWGDASVASPVGCPAICVSSALDVELLDGLPPVLQALSCFPARLRRINCPVSASGDSPDQLLIGALLNREDWNLTIESAGAELALPDLADGSTVTWSGWQRQLWQDFADRHRLTPLHRGTLEAGLRLLHGDFDGSHAAAQALEGRGRWKHADYWHAILHRREPDPGNAGYWFRRVGDHPLFARLAEVAGQIAAPFPRLQELQRRGAMGRWDPLLFIDLCDQSLTLTEPERQCLRILQYHELLGLVRSTWTQAD